MPSKKPHDKVRKALEAADLEQRIGGALLAGLDNADVSTIKSIIADSESVRLKLLRMCDEIAEEEDIRLALITHYIELKSKWMALNTQMNYQFFRNGACDPHVQGEGTAVSFLLNEIGDLLPAEDVAKVEEFLIAPTAA